MPSPYRLVHVTVETKKQAIKVAGALLDYKVVACVNILPKMTSMYWWKGKVEATEEHLLIIKTRATLIENVIQVVRENHEYENPEIITLPIMEGTKEYLDWIGASTNTAKPMKDLPREQLEKLKL